MNRAATAGGRTPAGRGEASLSRRRAGELALVQSRVWEGREQQLGGKRIDMVAPQTGTPPAERSEAGRHWTGTARQPVQLARPREDTGSCGTLLCSALHCGAPQGRTATASTRRPARTGGGVASSRRSGTLRGRPDKLPARGQATGAKHVHRDGRAAGAFQGARQHEAVEATAPT
jgi:hypothetical protein